MARNSNNKKPRTKDIASSMEIFHKYWNMDVRVEEAISKEFKNWAFEVKFGSQCVYVHDKRNLRRIRQIVQETLGEEDSRDYKVYSL